MPLTKPVYANDRREDREECHHRTSATGPAGAPIAAMIVNISPGGLMARCDAVLKPGDAMTFRLPNATVMKAHIRWALGGRIGCEFDRPLAPTAFYALLPKLQV